MWIVLFLWTLFKEFEKYKCKKQFKNFFFTYIMIVVSLAAIFMGIKISCDFNKPTLFKAHYYGDFNGLGIDFKTDGTYIYDDSAIGTSDYTYGNYAIKNDTVLLKVENYLFKRFIIKKEYSEEYLSEIDSLGNESNPYLKFRIVIDNRK